MKHPAIWLAVGVILVGAIAGSAIVFDVPASDNSFPVRQLLLPAGQEYTFNGTLALGNESWLKFSIPSEGAVLIGQMAVDHLGSVHFGAVPLYPSAIWPQCTASSGYSGPAGAETFDLPLSPGDYGFGSACLSWGNATVLLPIEIVYPS